MSSTPQDLFGDMKAQWITICHGLHWRAMAPISSFTVPQKKAKLKEDFEALATIPKGHQAPAGFA